MKNGEKRRNREKKRENERKTAIFHPRTDLMDYSKNDKIFKYWRKKGYAMIFFNKEVNVMSDAIILKAIENLTKEVKSTCNICFKNQN